MLICSAAALALAAVGLAGTLSFEVNSRRREMGIRAAMGAPPDALFFGIVMRALRILLPGLLLGVASVLLLIRTLRAMFEGLPALDPASLLTPPFVLFLMALCIAWMPALSASRVNPSKVLREE